MSEKFDDVVATAVKTQAQGKELMEKLMAVAQPDAVFSEPLSAGDYAVVTASEVSVGMGFGFGVGGGTAPESFGGQGTTSDEPESQVGEASGFASGGGGGFSMGRPVAVISIGPGAVRVEPVRDLTKIGLALLSTAGAMLMMLGRMRRASRF